MSRMVYNRAMLATDLNLEKLRYPVYCMPKIDGVRALNLNGTIMPRSFKGFRNKLINERYSNTDFIGLDGEFVMGSPVDSDCCRNTTSHTSSVDGGCPDWYLFDYVTSFTYDLPYYSRLNYLRERYNKLKNKYPFLHLVENKLIYEEKDLIEYEEEVLYRGYEGLIVRNAYSTYKFGRSTVNDQSLLRLKRFQDGEAVIVSLIEARANNNPSYINENGLSERSTRKEYIVPKDTLGSFECELLSPIKLAEKTLNKGDLITVSAGKLNKKERKYIFDNPDNYIGKIVKFKYFASGSKDSVRFPTFQSFRAEEDMS